MELPTVRQRSWLWKLKQIVGDMGPAAELFGFLFGLGEVACRHGKNLCAEVADIGRKTRGASESEAA